MNKFISLMAVFVIALFAGNSLAFTPPPSPAPSSWISDTSGVLSGPAHRRLDTHLKQINQSSANEVAALIVPTLGGEDISDVANATFKSWGVGKKGLDNGVLVVLAMKEHKSRIETGKGVEGDLPDLKTQDILNQVLRPHMKQGDVEGALDSTFAAVSSSIENHRADVAAQAARAKASPPPVVVTPVNPASPLPTTTTSPSCDVGAVGSGTSVLGLLVFFFFAAMLLLNRVAKKQEKARQAAELLARQQREQERKARLAEQERMAMKRRETLIKLERDRQKLRDEAERKRLALQQKSAATVLPVVIPVPAAHLKPMVHREPPAPITRSVVHSEAPHKQEPIVSVASAAAVITAAAIAEREAIAARQRAVDLENQRAETRRLAERESAERREEERARARQREADEAADRARRQREQDDEDRRRRDAESSSSSSSSYDYGSSSSGSDSGSSGGFGGGDSGGGGSSSGW